MASEASNMFLYWGSGSMPCMVAMVTLEEKGLQGYGNKMIEFSKQEHKSEEVLKINPRGQMPTFRHGDIAVNESFAICLYLENAFKKQGTQLIPDDVSKQALVYQRLFETDSIQLAGVRDYYYYIMMNKDNLDEELVQKKKAAVTQEVDRWEGYLNGQKYICGDDFTLADVFLFSKFCFMVRGSLDLSNRPNLKRYYEEICERPSVKASWPPHYKTSPATQAFVGI